MGDVKNIATDVHMLHVTTLDREEALVLARAVVKERLAACANVINGVTSVYEWKGDLQEEGECILILKTTAAKVTKLTERLVELHSYDCPCVVSWPLTSGNPEFLDWIGEQTE